MISDQFSGLQAQCCPGSQVRREHSRCPAFQGLETCRLRKYWPWGANIYKQAAQGENVIKIHNFKESVNSEATGPSGVSTGYWNSSQVMIQHARLDSIDEATTTHASKYVLVTTAIHTSDCEAAVGGSAFLKPSNSFKIVAVENRLA